MSGEEAEGRAGQGRGTGAVDYGKTAGFLSIGVGLTGLITYVYFFIASHTLSKPDYGEIAVLWSAVFITVSTLYRPVDQLLSRHVSESLATGAPVGEPIRVAAKIQLALAAGFAVVALALREPLQDDLLNGNATLYWIGFAAILAYAASYFARGYLAGVRNFVLFSVMILSESIFRTSFAVIVAVGLLQGQSAVAIGILAAPSLSLLVVPLAFARRSRHEAPPDAEAAVKDDAGFSLTHGAGFAAAVLLVMFSEQVFLNAGPLLVQATSGAAAAGFIFNVLMIARAPLQLFQAVSTSLLPHLTTLHHDRSEDSDDDFHRSVRLMLAAVAAFTAIVALAVLVAGPQLMQLAWSDKFSYPRADLLIVTVGMGLYLSSVTVNQACVAQGNVRRVGVRWIACAALFVTWCALPIVGDEFLRVEVGFTGAAALLLALLSGVYARPGEAAEVGPGSGEELEAQLAAADEGA